MAKSLIILAIVAFGAAAAFSPMRPPNGNFDKKHGHHGGDHGRHGHHGGDHGHHHGPPPPEVMRFKALFFVHSTFCYGLPLPNFSRPDANETRAHMMMPRKPMVGAGKAFRQIIADASSSESVSGSNSDSSSSEENNDNMRPKPNATVRAEEARLSRVVLRAAANVILTQTGNSSDDLCTALVQAEQAWIDFRKANNMSCGGDKRRHGPHGGPHGGPRGPRPPMPNHGMETLPVMNGTGSRPMFAAAVMPTNWTSQEQRAPRFQLPAKAAHHKKH